MRASERDGPRLCSTSRVTLSLVERLIFRHFFDGLALGGALAEWLLACWLLTALRAAPPLVHAGAVVALFAINRLAALPVQERDPRPGPIGPRTGHAVLAVAFGAMMSAGALAVTAVLWAAGSLFGTRAEAGGLALGTVTPLLGPAFDIAGPAVVALTAAAVAHGYARGYRALRVEELAVPLAGAPALRIVHLSDFHLGPFADPAAVRDALERAMALAPDLVCVTGDIVDSPAADLDVWLPELRRLRAPLGVYAILGNHDRHVGAERVAAALARHTDWRLLRDEVVAVEARGARLWLVGLEDRPETQKTDALPGLLAQVPPGAPAILLAHRPSVFPAAAAAGVRLTLAGHTHGGQVAVPGLPALNVARALGTRLDVGTFRRGDCVLHVSRGIGTSGQRIRVGVPREITVVRTAG
jgi:predicted MPP superfamily phosphohydrolase